LFPTTSSSPATRHFFIRSWVQWYTDNGSEIEMVFHPQSCNIC
jgi:hypothetical protein